MAWHCKSLLNGRRVRPFVVFHALGSVANYSTEPLGAGVLVRTVHFSSSLVVCIYAVF